jgi:hypothetical protein
MLSNQHVNTKKVLLENDIELAPFSFFRDELLDVKEDFLEILKSPEKILEEWGHLDGSAGNGIVSLAELDFWLCVRFPLLRNTVPIRMTFYRVLKMMNSKNGFIQKQAMYHVLIIIFCSNQALRWWNELPSKSADKVVNWMISKKVETLDERMSLEDPRQIKGYNKMRNDLESRVAVALEAKQMFFIEFDYFCDLMASFKTTLIDIMYCNLEPVPVDPIDMSIKPKDYSNIQKRIRAKVIKATREQDHLSSTTLPYMNASEEHYRAYSSRPSTGVVQSRPVTGYSRMHPSCSPSVTGSRPMSRESVFAAGARPLTLRESGTISEMDRPTTSSGSVFSLFPGTMSFAGSIAHGSEFSLEAVESACEVIPGIIYAKNIELQQARRSYLKAFGLQHPHTGSYYHSPQHNHLLSHKQTAGLNVAIPDFQARLNDSPLKIPTFELLRNKPGKNPLVFSTERSPSKFGKDLKLAMHPRRPWSVEFSSACCTNGTFSMSKEEMIEKKNQSPVTRALSPTAAMMLSSAASPKRAPTSTASKKMDRREWDSSGSPLSLFEKNISKPFAFIASTGWT